MVRGRDDTLPYVDKDIRQGEYWCMILGIKMFNPLRRCTSVGLALTWSHRAYGNKATPLLDIVRTIFQF
jgi:hypothetical protein